MFSSIAELLKDKETLAKIDGVIICTGHSVHAEMGLQFLNEGKHIFMENPNPNPKLNPNPNPNPNRNPPKASTYLWRSP